MRSLLHAARKARRRSPRELWTRAAQRALAAGERGQLLVFGTPQGAPRAMGTAPVRDSDTVVRLTGPNSAFFPGLAAADRTVEALRHAAPADEAAVLDRAARVASGHVPVLGHGWIDIGTDPDWHREPLAGLRAPLQHWSRIPYLDTRLVGDHKVLWEFNRHQFFVTLGQAWRYTGDERWAESWIHYTASWLDQNPARVGVNWASSLEVAYRAISWCWAARLFAGSRAVSEIYSDRLRDSIHAHGRHVARYLSTYFSPNTHLTGEALGLFYIAVTFPELPQAAKWRALGAEILEAELPRQVHRDGVYFEQATQYHRYTAEIYLHFLLLSEAAGEARGERITGTLHRLFDVLLALTRADGTMPLIGDDDGGRLVQLDGDRPDQLRELLSAGAVALNRPDLAVAGAGAATMSTWLSGPDAPARLALLAESGAPAPTAQAFSRGGLYVMRDPASSGTGHAAIDAGPHGALSFGHSHADALAIELYAGAGPLLVDSGTLAYDGAKRDAYRSTAAHNTVEVDGESTCLPGASFKWRTVADARCDGWTAEAGLTWFRGHHDGYARLELPVAHRREVVHPGSGVWIVTDRLSSPGDHRAVLRWHLAAGIEATVVEQWHGGCLIALSRAMRHVATIALIAEGGAFALEPGEISPQFGIATATTIVTWRGELRRDLRLQSIVLDWTSLAVPAVTLHLPGAVVRQAAGPSDHDGRGAQSVLHAGGDEVDYGAGLRARSDLAWVEPSMGGAADRVAAVGVRWCTLGAGPLAGDSADRWLVATLAKEAWSTRAGTLSPVDY